MKDVVFTVDVEGHVGKDPVKRLIYGDVDGEKCGIDLIMDICDRYEVKGLFFVDIAEAFDFGEIAIAEVLHHIVERGHDVGVHIHPDHISDPKRLFLFEYSEEEQREIIKKCTEFYNNTLGVAPKAFRAGKYGANHTTLDILSQLGYIADFSEFYGQKWCGIKPEITSTQSVQLSNGLIEIPTMAYRNSVPGIFSRIDKIDLSMPYSEYKYVMRMYENDTITDPIVLFAHSFSLINWRNNPDFPKKNYHEVKKLDRVFAYVDNNPNLRFASLDSIVSKQFTRKASIDLHNMGTCQSAYYMIPRILRVLKMRVDLKIQNNMKERVL